MRHVWFALASCTAMLGQNRPVDWPFLAGDAQRSGWEKADTRITRENVKDFRLVLKQKLDNGPGGPYSLTPPVVIGNLISYRGFKELGFVAGSSGQLWSIDLDLDRIFWRKQLGPPSSSCSSVVTGVPALTPPLNFAARPRPVAGPTASPGAPPTPAGAPVAPRGILGAGGFGAARPAFALSSDGKLHLLNTSNGDDLVPPIAFIPAGAKASNLIISNGMIYTTTDGKCANTSSGVYAIDLNKVDADDAVHSAPGVVSFVTAGGGNAAIGTDGTVYVQTQRGIAALDPKTLAEKGHFQPGSEGSSAAPVIFTEKGGHDMIAAATHRGLSLFDTKSLDVAVTHVEAGGIRAGLSTFLDASGARWIIAPMKDKVTAFTVEDRDGKPSLTKAWASPAMDSPASVVITGGVVFALSTGGHAILYALDALTGAVLYSTGREITAPGQLTGLTIANGRVFFTTTDNTLYGFGIFLER